MAGVQSAISSLLACAPGRHLVQCVVVAVLLLSLALARTLSTLSGQPDVGGSIGFKLYPAALMMCALVEEMHRRTDISELEVCNVCASALNQQAESAESAAHKYRSWLKRVWHVLVSALLPNLMPMQLGA